MMGVRSLIGRIGSGLGGSWGWTGRARGSPSLILAQHPVGLRGLFPYAAVLRLRGTAIRSRGSPRPALGDFCGFH